MENDLVIFDHLDDLVNFATEKWLEILDCALKERPYFTVALPGGTTPAPLYRKIASLAERYPWERTHVFQVDERFVPFDHEDSNYRMIREILLDRVPLPAANVHPVAVGAGSVQEAAEAYDREIRNFFTASGREEAALPSFDLIFLGVGKDGHTASLFPGSPVLGETRRVAAPVVLDDPGMHDRVTLTLPVLNQAKNLIFLLTGREKASILGRIVNGKDLTLPASMVSPEGGKVILLADSCAARELKMRTQDQPI